MCQELGLAAGSLDLQAFKAAEIGVVRCSLDFLLEEMMPSKDFWAGAARHDPALFLADAESLRETLTWLEDFLSHQEPCNVALRRCGKGKIDENGWTSMKIGS